jgi:hypothetical protein
MEETDQSLSGGIGAPLPIKINRIIGVDAIIRQGVVNKFQAMRRVMAIGLMEGAAQATETMDEVTGIKEGGEEGRERGSGEEGFRSGGRGGGDGGDGGRGGGGRGGGLGHFFLFFLLWIVDGYESEIYARASS